MPAKKIKTEELVRFLKKHYCDIDRFPLPREIGKFPDPERLLDAGGLKALTAKTKKKFGAETARFIETSFEGGCPQDGSTKKLFYCGFRTFVELTDNWLHIIGPKQTAAGSCDPGQYYFSTPLRQKTPFKEEGGKDRWLLVVTKKSVWDKRGSFDGESAGIIGILPRGFRELAENIFMTESKVTAQKLIARLEKAGLTHNDELDRELQSLYGGQN